MIGYLKGKTVFSDDKKTIILTESGVGYEVNYAKYPAQDSELELYIHHHVSENDQSLWGFDSLEEKKMFELLKSVNKVGSSKAYPLVQLGVKNLVSAITFEQTEILTQAPGIGKKMAEQIILSLKDKMDKTQFFKAQDLAKVSNSAQEEKTDASRIDGELFQEALQALESLGYKDKQVVGILSDKMNTSVASSEELIKLVLREL